MADLTRRFTTNYNLETTRWTQNYVLENQKCVKRAEGLEGEKKLTAAEGWAKITSPTGFDGFFRAVQTNPCEPKGYECWVTTFYVLAQPKTLTDNLTAKIPELSYTYSQRQKETESAPTTFGGGIFRIFFSQSMEKMGDIGQKLYKGTPIHGKGLQNYYSPNGWEIYWDPATADEQGAKDLTGGLPANNVPVDTYGLGGTKAAWDYVQRALTPLP